MLPSHLAWFALALCLCEDLIHFFPLLHSAWHRLSSYQDRRGDGFILGALTVCVHGHEWGLAPWPRSVWPGEVTWLVGHPETHGFPRAHHVGAPCCPLLNAHGSQSEEFVTVPRAPSSPGPHVLQDSPHRYRGQQSSVVFLSTVSASPS